MKTGLLLVVLSAAWGQATPSPTWKEFSIGPPIRGQAGFSREGIRAEGVPLRRVLAHAYGLPEQRILGPGWLDDRFAMKALVNNPDDLAPLLQQEFAKRFQMLAHRETRELPVFVLRAIEGAAASPKSGVAGPSGGREVSDRSVKVNYGTVRDFADALAAALGRPVFDETGIEARLDFSLSWKPGDAASLQAAVKNQLGMQLEEEKRSLEILVIDHIEKPHFDK
jgi:uncharacterized protein (TIGR03435 family)